MKAFKLMGRGANMKKWQFNLEHIDSLLKDPEIEKLDKHDQMYKCDLIEGASKNHQFLKALTEIPEYIMKDEFASIQLNNNIVKKTVHEDNK